MSFAFDKNWEPFVKACDNAIAQFNDEFESDLKELMELQDELLARLKEKRNSRKTESPANPPSNRKRKFQYGNVIVEEEAASDPDPKKLRSLDGRQSKENAKPADNCFSHSTPNKDVVDGVAANTPPNQLTLREDDVSIVTAGEKPRAKRNASVLAAAMNNKMLNEKLNIKKRRPDSQNLSNNIQDMLLDQQPSVVLNNVLKTNNKQQSLSIPKSSPVGKNGLVNQPKAESPLAAITEKIDEEKENQNDTTVTRSSRRTKKMVSEVMSVSHDQDTTVKSNTTSVQDADTVIMPPPSMPVIKKNPPRRGRQKKTDKDSTVDNDASSLADNNTSTRSLRTRSMRSNDTKVEDESLETSSRSTRSTRNNNSIDQAEKPKRTRGKKAKEVVELVEDVEPPVEIPIQPPVTKKQQRQTTADTSDSDEEFEKKKVKLRPKRTRKGKKQIQSESSTENSSPKPVNKETEEIPVNSETVPDVEVIDVEQKEPETVPVRRTRSSNKMAEVEEVQVTPKPKRSMEKNAGTSPVKTVVNETYVASPQVLSAKKNQKVLNETVVIEKSADRGTIILSTTPNNHGLPGPKDSGKKKTQRPALDQTVTLSPKKNGNATIILDQTVTLQKGAIIQYDPEHSLLSDDISEAEDTPPPLPNKLIPKFISQGIQKIKDAFMESPVKARVQQFERMAVASSPVKAAVNVDAPTRVTRTKTRAMAAAKEAETGSEEEKTEQDAAQVVAAPPAKKEKASRSKIATPLAAKTISQLKLPLPVPVSKQPGSSVKLGPPPQTLSAASSASDLLLSPRSNNNVAQTYLNNDDALRKREAMLQARSDEQRRKREEKCKAAALAREAQTKLRQAQWEKAEKERKEKLKQAQLEREEKIKEETEKKRLALERKAQETEDRRKAEEAARHAKLMEQEEEARKMAVLRKKQQEENERLRKKLLAEEREVAKKLQEMKNKSKKPGSLSSSSNSLHPGQQMQRPPSYKKFDELATDDESEDEKNVKRKVPNWAKKEHRYEVMKIQYYVKPSAIDKLYSTTVFNPNLMEIFPQIDRRKLVRTSSAVWKTPPRFSMMPKDYQ